MRWPQGSNAMPCVSPVVSVLRPRIAGTLARAPHPANGVRTEQLGLSSPIYSPWVERDFARPHFPTKRSFYLKTLHLRNEPPLQHRIPFPMQKLIRSIQTCAVSRSERPPLQHASQLPLGTPSEHFSASSRCHTSQNQDALAPRVQCHAFLP